MERLFPILRVVDFEGFFSIDPPAIDHRKAVFGGDSRLAEFIPIGDAVRADVPMRDDVILPKQYAIQRAAGHNQVFAVFGGDEFADKIVYGRVAHADKITAAFDAGLA